MNKSVAASELSGLIEARLTPYLSERCEIFKVPAIQLITANRYDLLIKLAYLDARYSNPDRATRLYDEHIRAFGLGSYTEPEKPEKKNLESFLIEFDAIYESLAKNGFDNCRSIIPLASDGSILNGAHRVACCIELGIDVWCIKLNVPARKYDYSFFRDRGVEWDVLYTAIQMLQCYKPSIRCAIAWPIKRDVVESEFADRKGVFVKESIRLDERQATALVRQVYSKESWLGSPEDGYSGAANKAEQCRGRKSTLTLYVFEPGYDEDLHELKERIRQVAKVGKHCIHISDGYDDTELAWTAILNENFLDFSFAENVRSCPEKDSKLIGLEETLYKANIEKRKVCLVNGVVIELLGIRSAADVDLVGDADFPSQGIDGLDFDDRKYIIIGKTAQELVEDPRNYFHYFGFKILSVPLLLQFKLKRYELLGDLKDKLDAEAISASLDQRGRGKRWKVIKVRVFFLKKRVFSRFRRAVKMLLVATSTYDFVKKILKGK